MRLSPVALGALVGVGLAAAALPPAARAVRDLRSARVDRATLAQLAAAPAPSRAIVVAGAITASDAGVAADLLSARIRAVAGSSGVLIEQASAVPSPALARVRLRGSGSEDAITGFADTLERGSPVVRFASWSIEQRGGRVTLTGEAVAPWQ